VCVEPSRAEIVGEVVHNWKKSASEQVDKNALSNSKHEYRYRSHHIGSSVNERVKTHEDKRSYQN